jgi:hypothetical protein
MAVGLTHRESGFCLANVCLKVCQLTYQKNILMGYEDATLAEVVLADRINNLQVMMPF